MPKQLTPLEKREEFFVSDQNQCETYMPLFSGTRVLFLDRDKFRATECLSKLQWSIHIYLDKGKKQQQNHLYIHTEKTDNISSCIAEQVELTTAFTGCCFPLLPSVTFYFNLMLMEWHHQQWRDPGISWAGAVHKFLPQLCQSTSSLTHLLSALCFPETEINCCAKLYGVKFH